MKTVVLDPGHGGTDPGSCGFGLQEKELTLKLARLVALELSGYQARVVLTRDKDVSVMLAARAELANAQKADFFCSIHINSGGGTGFESYRYTRAFARTRGLQLAVHHLVAEYLARHDFRDRGIKWADFAVLRLTQMPAVLLECLFIDSARDAAALKEGDFLDGLAGAIAQGLVLALELVPVSPPSPAPGDGTPEGEIARLRERGLIVGEHKAADPVNWGEFATVLNRLADRIDGREKDAQKTDSRGQGVAL